MIGDAPRALALAAALLAAPAAWAQPAAEEATRVSLIDAAREAHRAGDDARALDLAMRAGAIRWTATLRGFVAREELALGRTADALGNAELCLRLASSEAASPSHDEILEWCRAQSAALRERVGRVVVRVPSPSPPGMQVTVGGRALRAELFGVPYLVTPGTIAVDAAAPGYRPLHRSVEVASGVEVPVELSLEPDAAAPAVVAAPPAVTPPRRRVRVATRRVRSPVGPVLMGVGAASAVTGLVLWIVANARHSDLEAECAGRCTAGEIEQRGAPIDAMATAANVTGLAGVGVAAAGTVLFFTLSRTEPVGPRVALVPAPGGLGVVGVF